MPDNQAVPKPTVFVLFGATGDLAHRLVLPAFFRLAQARLLPEDWRLVGNGRGHVSHEDFQERVRDSLEEFGPKPSEEPWDEFRSRLRFAGGGFEASDPGSLLEVLDGGRETTWRGSPAGALFRRAAFSVREALPRASARTALRRVPGSSTRSRSAPRMETFKQLDRVAHAVFKEQQIYRIDHFLGKEATQAIHVARFANGLFSGAWDRRSHRERADRRARDPRRWDAGRLLRLDRRHPRHVRHPPLPAGRRGLYEDPEVL